MGIIQKITKFIFGKGLGGETIRYIAVGGLTTLINFGLFVVMHEALHIDSTISNVTSISVSILFAYVTNKLIVFNSHHETRNALFLEFVKFVGSRLFTMALEIGVVLLFDSVLGLSATLGKVVSQVLVIATNYVVSKLLVFRRESQ